ncbi:MAG: hypothetical protein KPI85_05695 [cyanobacterium endosymbiont of Epithemia adnata isolate EadnSB Bon19]
MSIAIGIVVGLIIGGVIGIFLSSFSKERKLAAQLERSTKALKEAEILQQQQAQEIKQLRQSPSQMQEIEQSYQIKIQEIEQSYQEQSEELSQTKTKLSKLEQNERQIQKIQQTYQTQLEILEQTYQARLKETLQQVQRFAPVLETNQAHIQQIEQIYQTQLQEQQQAHEQAINELEKAYDEGDFALDEWGEAETSDTLSEDLVHDPTEALSLEQTEGRNQNRVADLLQQKKSDDLDFFEMLPTEEETTKDLSGAFIKDSKNPYVGFFESETKDTTHDPDEIFSSFLDTEKSEENLTNLLETDDKNKS